MLHKVKNKDDDSDNNISTDILERISIRSGNKINFIAVDDITYIQAEGDYVQIYTNDGRFLKEDTMKYYEEHLPPNKFFRIHRSYIVNLEKILRIELYDKKNHLITLTSGNKISISALAYSRLRERLGL